MVIQFFVIVFFANQTSYNAMVQLATIMYLLPYIFSALYLVLLALRADKNPATDEVRPDRATNSKHLVVAAVAFIYSLWLIYAADLVYVLFGALAVLPGIIPYVLTKRARGERLFNAFEWVVVTIVVIGAVFAVVGLVNGSLVL